MQKITFGSSPTKENTQPSKQSPDKRTKNGTLLQLLSFVKNSGLVLPSSIARIISNGLNNQSPLKQTTNNRDNVDDSKKLKVQLSDLQFQYKKLQEDFAQFKRSSKAQRQKDVRKYEEVINRLKSTLQNTSEDSSYTISKMKQTHLQEINQLKQRSRLQLEQQKTKLHNDYQQKVESQHKIHMREIAQTQRNNDRRYNQKVRAMEEEIEKLKIDNSLQLKETNARHRQIVEDKQKRHDSIRLALQSQRKTQEKLHQKTKVEANKQKEKLVTELCYQKNVNIQLKQVIQAQDKEISRLKGLIRDKDIDIQLLNEKTKKQLAQNQNSYRQRIEKLQIQQSERIVELGLSQKAELQSFLKKIYKIETICKEKQILMQANLEQLANNFQKRPSKRQDLNQLQKMKWALTKKQDEVRKLSRDLKHCGLELENKQQMYTRIFRGNSMSRDKKMRQKQKEDKEQAIVEQKLLKEPLFRKSQTSDVKFLFKMYSNAKNG